MRSDPENRSALKRHRPACRQEILEPPWDFVAAMRQQPVVGHPDPYVDREEVHDRRHGQVFPGEEEQCGDRANMEGSHEDAGNPVNAAFLIRAAHAQILLQTLVCLTDRGVSIGFTRDGRELEDGDVGVRSSLITLCC